MKRHGNLWPEITSFENLLVATKKAQKSKRFRENVLEFNHNLEHELFQLQADLRDQTYTPGKYRHFQIYEPKPRLISAAPYRDRVVHHALCNIITPIFESTFISDSYANRIGFGTHKALRRFTQFCRSSRYILQCDIRRYFPNIDHAILKSLIRQKIKCPETLWLIDRIIDSAVLPDSDVSEHPLEYFPDDDLLTPILRSKGLPIGNLTSQFFANIYLNGFDHFIKENLKIRKYLRYVDDFALFSDDHRMLAEARIALENYLAQLRLRIHPIKSQLFDTRHGANFVGFRVLPIGAAFPKEVCIRVRNDNLHRNRIRHRSFYRQLSQGHISLQQVRQSLQSWQAHLSHGDTWKLRQKIFSTFPADWLCALI